MASWLALLLLSAAVTAAAPPPQGGANAGPPGRPLDLSSLGAPTFTSFTGGYGIPDAAIEALATDADGFVWLASPGGLFRFDGRRFEPAPVPEAAARVRDLFLDHQGKVWASPYDPGLARYDGRDWKVFDKATLPVHFRRVAETTDDNGVVTTWALATDGGLYLLEGEDWREDPGNAQLPKGVLNIARTSRIGGKPRLWVATFNEGVWYREDGGAWQRFRAPGFDPSQVEDLLVTQSDSGEELWIATFGRGLYRLSDQGLRGFSTEGGELRSNLVYRLKATRHPNGDPVVWAATRSGLVRVHADQAQVFDRLHGLPSDVVRNLHLWRSPSGVDVLWIATEGGVARTVIGANAWQRASLLGARSNGVFGVRVEPDGRGGERLWVASSQDGLGLYEDGRWRTFNAANGGLAAADVRMVTRVPDEAGRPVLWIGAGGGDLFRGETGPAFRKIDTPWEKHAGQAVMHLIVRSVAGRHEQWIATRQSGIYRFSAGRWTAFRPEGVVGQWSVVALVEQIDASGRSWLWASTNQGLARYDNREWKLLGRDAGFPDGALTGLSLLPDVDGRAVLWAGSQRNGILRVDVTDPQAPRLLPEGGLPKPPDPATYGASRDSRGRIYICTNNGVQQLVPEPSGGYRERVFARRDGMIHEECNTNAQWIDAHDRFWTGTLGGLAVYDPARDVPDRQAKPLRITHQQIDGHEVGLGAVRLPPGARDLRIDFALLAWHRERESLFRSQLVGYDPRPGPWGPVAYRVFGALPPGSYTLKVEARDYAGVESVPLLIPVEALPAWWQRLTVRIAGALLVLLAGPAFYLRRMRRLSRQKAELSREVAARTAELAAASERLASLSREDALTGVANRRRLDEALDEEWRRAVRQGADLSLLLLDVDHFKAYNDAFGHQSGDACLKTLAGEVAAAHTRAGELVARYGGEEFVIILPGVSRDAALLSAEQTRLRVARLSMPHPASEVGHVTVSIGVGSTKPTLSGSPADLVGAADRALYRAKREGRNCVRG